MKDLNKQKLPWLIVIVLIFVLYVLLLNPSTSNASTDGETIFTTYCTSCHNIGKGDSPTGPDLKGIVKKRGYKDAWLQKWISNPMKMMATDPIGKKLEKEKVTKPYKYSMMVSLGLNEDQVNNVIEYLKTQN